MSSLQRNTLNKELLSKIKKDLEPLSKFEVVIYGSLVKGESTLRSDIDVAVITREKDEEKNMKTYWDIIGLNHEPYDIKIFELLPLYIKAQVLRDYIVLFGDVLEISEYFYSWWKIWRDMEKRYLENQDVNLKEIIKKIRKSEP